MSRVGIALPLLLALAAPLAAQSAPPDRLEELLWEGAANANSVPAYDTYLRRYPAGAHADAARAALAKLGVAPVGPAGPAPAVGTVAAPPAAVPAPVIPANVAAAPPAPPAVAGEPATEAAVAEEDAAAAAGPLFLCRPQIAAGAALDRAGEGELTTYLQALKTSSVEAYQRYLDAYPQGVFAPAVSALVKARTARAHALAATPVPGPVAAHLRHPLAATPADYPPEARHLAQPAAASAVWEIGEDGCVQSCRIDRSSGNPALDDATCRLATAKGRYDPARDASGKPIRAVGSGTVNWAVVR